MRSHQSRSSQTDLPGCEHRIGDALQRKADQPLKPQTAQSACDVGLFGDSHKQGELNYD
jgi:hypothetical protein